MTPLLLAVQPEFRHLAECWVWAMKSPTEKMKIAPGLLSTGLTPSFSSSVLLALDTHEPGVGTPIAVSQNDSVPDPDCGRNGTMAWVAALPVRAGLRSPHWFGTVQDQIWVSWAGVSDAGAEVFTAGCDQSTASPASATNAEPPAWNGGSAAPRAREERAKLVHSGPLLLLVKVASWLMPAEDPSGRLMFAQSVFSGMESPIAPLIGLTASQLSSNVVDVLTVLLHVVAAGRVLL